MHSSGSVSRLVAGSSRHINELSGCTNMREFPV